MENTELEFEILELEVDLKFYRDSVSKVTAYAKSKELAFELISRACILEEFDLPILENIKEIRKNQKRNERKN